jgi:hypothetical protein
MITTTTVPALLSRQHWRVAQIPATIKNDFAESLRF